jgi:hypothetical protein
VEAAGIEPASRETQWETPQRLTKTDDPVAAHLQRSDSPGVQLTGGRNAGNAVGGWSGLSLQVTQSPDEATVDGISFAQYFSKQLDDRRNLRKNRRLGEEILAATVS